MRCPSIYVSAALMILFSSFARGETQLSTDTPKLVVASIYHENLDGKKTSSGVPYNQHEITAAHRKLPLGSRVEMKNPRTNQQIDVLVNDRGPHKKGRDFDLSKKAAENLGVSEEQGTVQLEAKVIETPAPGTR